LEGDVADLIDDQRDELLSPGQAARVLGVSTRTVAEWIHAGNADLRRKSGC